MSKRADHGVPTQQRPRPARGAHRVLHADLQPPILHHIDAVVQLPRPEDVLPFQKLHKDHVFAKFQEQRLLKVTQDPTEIRTRGAPSGRTLSLLARPQGELPRAAEPAALAPGCQQGRSLRFRKPHQLLSQELREVSGHDCEFEPGL